MRRARIEIVRAVAPRSVVLGRHTVLFPQRYNVHHTRRMSCSSQVPRCCGGAGGIFLPTGPVLFPPFYGFLSGVRVVLCATMAHRVEKRHPSCKPDHLLAEGSCKRFDARALVYLGVRPCCVFNFRGRVIGALSALSSGHVSIRTRTTVITTKNHRCCMSLSGGGFGAFTLGMDVCVAFQCLCRGTSRSAAGHASRSPAGSNETS